MKCPRCDGNGIDIFESECRFCGGMGVVEPLTNEEYIRTANVNDMARCIATKLLELARHEYGIYDVVDYATVFEWLKEKHE